MRQWGVSLLALSLVLAATLPVMALPQPPPGPYVPHANISISSNADFNATNGVVAGTGTPGDPFIISGWAFVTAGVAIKITNVTASFVIRDSHFDAGTGIEISAMASVGVIINNQFIVRNVGVSVTNADAIIIDNSFSGNPSVGANGRGVVLATSNARVESNAFMYLAYGIHAEKGSPAIICNDIHDDVVLAGIFVRLTTNARIECNIITQCTLGIKVEATILSLVANNTVTACYKGVDVSLAKDLNMTNNSIRFSLYVQVRIDTTSGNVTGNVIVDGRAEGVIIVRSPILFANNTIHNNINVGVLLSATTGNISANVVSYNALGIQLEGGSIVTLTANVMSNNSVGIDIPYSSRQAIVNMSANIVNNVNIDGTLNASQQVYFYKEANVNISGQIRDSGFSAGFYGSLTAQGGIVLYEVDTVNVNATVISHHTIGVGVVNSFNVNVNNSIIVSNLIGIKAEVKAGVGIVPNCVVAGKNVNITIPVDPIATIGIDLKGCLGIFGNVTVSIVDTGIKVDAQAGLVLFNSTIVDTKVGLDVQAMPNNTNISGNTFNNNRIGVRLSGTVGIFRNNTVQGNVEVGVRLENSANLRFENNNVSFNEIGVLDAEVCAGSLTCSKLEARNNAFVGNTGDAVRINGHTTWRGDVVLGNEGNGLVLNGGATLDGVVAIGNEGDGVRIVGDFEVDDGNFSDNDEDGLDVYGSGELTDSVFLHNEGAGLRAQGAHISALRLNISRNFDGIALGDATAGVGPDVAWPALPSLLPFLWQINPDNPLPLEIHRSSFYANERDAIRAGLNSVDATHNFWGRPQGPSVNIGDTIGAFQNGVTPGVQFLPYYVDPAMTTTGPVFLL